MTVEARAARERDAHNHGLVRDRYTRILRHATAYSEDERRNRLHRALQAGHHGDVLEIGSSCWGRWLPEAGVSPQTLHVINISEVELERGLEEGADSGLQPQGHLMDAHSLDFPADSFDLVYGGSILHHLELDTVLSEIRRVLRPGGRMVFVEPLNINPVAKVTRLLTPRARTDDEVPFGLRELSVIHRHFHADLEFYELASVPAGVVSGLLFRNEYNPLMQAAYRVDTLIKTVAPPARYLYRKFLVEGRPRASHVA